MNRNELMKVMRYDSDNGKFYALRNTGRRKIGSTLGYIRADGYRMIFVGSKWQYAHRLVWFFEHGRLPQNEIDHINGCRDDNRIENLRECTRSENMRNTRKRGVCFHKNNKKWQASIRVEGRRIYLGSFATEDEACVAYTNAVIKYHGEFGNITQPSEKPTQEALFE